MASAAVFGIKGNSAFIAIMLVGGACDAQPKLMPLPPIAPGLQLSRLFDDHMVLQRDTKVKVWGWATAGEKLAVEFASQTKSATTAADGSWQVVLDPMSANATGSTLTVRSVGSSEKAEINDVLVGEVWLMGGQSNMAFPFWIRPDGFDQNQVDANPQYRNIRCVTTLNGFMPDWEKLDWVHKEPRRIFPSKMNGSYLGQTAFQCMGRELAPSDSFSRKACMTNSRFQSVLLTPP